MIMFISTVCLYLVMLNFPFWNILLHLSFSFSVVKDEEIDTTLFLCMKCKGGWI